MPLALAASFFDVLRKLAITALWGVARSALTLVLVGASTGVATAMLAYAYSSLTDPNGRTLADWDGLVAGLEAGSVNLSLDGQAYWIILSVGVLALFMIRGAAGMAGALIGHPRADFSGGRAAAAATAGVAVRVMAASLQRVVSVSAHAQDRRSWVVAAGSGKGPNRRQRYSPRAGTRLAARVAGMEKDESGEMDPENTTA
jgi:hypothetical protein